MIEILNAWRQVDSTTISPPTNLHKASVKQQEEVQHDTEY